MIPAVLRDAGILARAAAASIVLAPGMVGARIHGAVTRARLESDTAVSALRVLGITERPVAIDALGGGRSNATYRVRFASRTLVLKCALATGTLLAMAARWVGPNPPCTVSGSARIAREARALTTLATAGVHAPAVIAASPRHGLLLVDHLAGESLPVTLARHGAASRIAAYARAIRAAHAAGITLGDAHPGNAIVSPDGAVALIDLEFAEHDTTPQRRAFDVAFAAAFFTTTERRIFIDTYGGDAAIDTAAADLAGYATLFAYERQRQRRAA